MENIFIISAAQRIHRSSRCLILSRICQKELYSGKKKILLFSFISFVPQIKCELQQQHLSSDSAVIEVIGTQKTRPGFVGEATESQTRKGLLTRAQKTALRKHKLIIKKTKGEPQQCANAHRSPAE